MEWGDASPKDGLPKGAVQSRLRAVEQPLDGVEEGRLGEETTNARSSG